MEVKETRYIPVPADLTQPCEALYSPPVLTGELVERVIPHYREVLAACNAQLEAIRSLEADDDSDPD